ncbi:Ig-like domain-containing protein [Pseudomonas salmasensis]|uniref:Ig-like domain-containing protein n=1 Tax=Pseudomonas salmasensis TaxID=2745514 RepID=UPI001C3CC342|nr:Ig-like domain-containing protein [Pseudomonas salmasensis]QXH79099.1 Ig-like domain-containing protein [Pseudomonas salmasensis]
MSGYPDSDSDRAPSASDDTSLPIACLPRQRESIAAGPQRVEDLDHPYSAYPAIPLSYVPGEVAVYGLGIRHVRPYALYSFENWTSQSSNDYFAIYFDDLVYAAADDLVEDTTLVRQNLAIPEERMPEGEVVTYGRVRRAGSGSESTSPQQIILIKTTRPGGTDIDPGSSWHTGLVMEVEGFPEGETLRLENIGLGVYCLIESYEHIRKNDVIELSWDGIFVLHTVTSDEAGAAEPIRVFVDKSIIAQGGQRGTLTLRFRVRDVVENFSGEKYQYSKPYFLNAELDPNLLGAPIFLVDDRESRQIDFDTQSGSTFTLIALTDRQFPEPDPKYKITVSLLCTRDDGTSETIRLGPVPDLNRGFTSIPIENDIIAKVVGGSLRVSFSWQADAPLPRESGSITITVVGTKVSMPVPSVSPIELGLIPAGEDITVTIPAYEPHDPGWLETLYITHVPPGGGNATIFSRAQYAGSQGGTYSVTAAELEQFNGRGPIQIYYTTNDGAAHILGGGALAIRPSAMLGAQVGERTADMPAPRLQGAIGNNVDPADVPGSDALVTFTYLDTKAGDTLHWSCVGSGLGGSASGTLTINSATAGKELNYPVTRDILDKNLNGSLRISYSLERAGPPKVVLRSEVLMLTVGKGVELERPIIEGASTSPDELNPLAAISGTRVIVKFRPMLDSDLITVDWITADHHGSFADNVAGNPTTHEASVWIDARTIARGIREGGNTINVQYYFHRGTFLYESVIVPLRLLPLTGLPTPTIEGISGPVLDLSQLSPTARTYIPVWSFIHADQLMWMTYESEGVVFEDTYTANEVTDDGVLNGINPPTPVDKIKLLGDGVDLTIKFWASLAERSDKNTAVLFGVRHYTIQALPGILPHPFINGTADTGPSVTVDPLPIEHDTTVTVRYTGMSGQDYITLEWIFADGTHHTAGKNGLDGGMVAFNLATDEVLHRSVNSTVCLKYSVKREGVADPIPSNVQTVRVNAIPAASLPQPRINNIAPGGTLNLNSFAGNALASVIKWSLSSKWNRAWLTCSSLGVSPFHVLTANGALITSIEAANGLVNKAVLRSWLEALPNNRQITITCEVEYGGNTDKARAVVFPTTSYTVAYPALYISTATMTLNGTAYIVAGWPKRAEYPGNTQTRAATGGRPPYTYTSQNPSVATVTSTGFVSGMRNGSTNIVVTDRAGGQVSYTVSVSNVWQVREDRRGMDWGAAVNWRKSLPGAIGHYGDAIRFMGNAYGWPLPVPYDSWYWVCTEPQCDAWTGVLWDSIDPEVVWCNQKQSLGWAWCLQP